MFELVEFPPLNWLTAFKALFALCIGHAVADFPLQGEYLATGKNRRFLIRLQDPSRPVSIWVVCMSAHCLIHAGAVWLITGSALLGMVEFVVHWGIDVAKCEGKTNFNQDQVLHVVCKMAYVAVAWAGWVTF
ncbi:hypothetical protein GCM10023213_33000 [Prosthecobacter algae]|uniref:DUF3307 domain-containing protein n=1 Tax=Prosthecobacter algae TaxID=1144682 RepID=A0ABP9PBG2_9BACT